MTAASLDYPRELRAIARRTSTRIRTRLATDVPRLAPQVAKWTQTLSPDGDEDYFIHAEAFPMLLLPWWFEESVCDRADPLFQRELVYSSMCGYYFTRMVDDVMDNDRPPDSAVLPALIFFHTEFARPYQLLFAGTDSFWEDFRRFSYEAAETASADARLASVTGQDFRDTSSRKVAGMKVPLAAVAHHRGHIDALVAWTEMVDRLGRWHQMRNDIAGWIGDFAGGRASYFLSRARSQAETLRISVPEWVLRYGIDWGAEQLDLSMADVLVAASALDSAPLVTYLDRRRQSSAQEWARLKASLARGVSHAQPAEESAHQQR
jgi:hypothetical protein